MLCDVFDTKRLWIGGSVVNIDHLIMLLGGSASNTA